MNEAKNIQEMTKWNIADARHSSLLSINYAFQNTIQWGGLVWRLTEKDLKEVRNMIDPDNFEKTGSQIWKWFYEKWNRKFITGITMKDLGSEFMRNLSRYYA